jgi:hypothetical protein
VGFVLYNKRNKYPKTVGGRKALNGRSYMERQPAEEKNSAQVHLVLSA